jgi:hypothetical protein
MKEFISKFRFPLSTAQKHFPVCGKVTNSHSIVPVGVIRVFAATL